MMAKKFNTEAELVAKFVQLVNSHNEHVVDLFAKRERRFGDEWIVYPETCGFDIVLRGRHSGITIGIEAKLSLNAKALCQSIQGATDYYHTSAPDYRAVLVPSKGAISGMSELAKLIGVTVLVVGDYGWDGGKADWRISPDLPNPFGQQYFERSTWHPWVPGEPLQLPAYIPDSVGGTPSPITLTPWKISAIKLCILLERRGYVTRRDMKVLAMSPTRWCDAFSGYLTPASKDGRYTHYVANHRTPDFKKQHPRNFDEIEDDWPTWSAGLDELP